MKNYENIWIKIFTLSLYNKLQHCANAQCKMQLNCNNLNCGFCGFFCLLHLLQGIFRQRTSECSRSFHYKCFVGMHIYNMRLSRKSIRKLYYIKTAATAALWSSKRHMFMLICVKQAAKLKSNSWRLLALKNRKF